MKAKPAEGETLAAPPAAIDLWFNELLDRDFNSVEIFATADEQAERGNLVTGKPTVSEGDRTHLHLAAPPLAPGAYVIHWKVLSRDGHSARGRIAFRVGGGAPAESPAAGAQTQPPAAPAPAPPGAAER